MPLLLEACPSFTDKWKEHRAYWREEESLYLGLGEFARHLVELHSGGQINEFPAVFDVVERLHLEGDDFVKEAATIGLLEGIQNLAGGQGIDPEGFVRYLRPLSAKWWGELNDFWGGKIPYVGASVNEA